MAAGCIYPVEGCRIARLEGLGLVMAMSGVLLFLGVGCYCLGWWLGGDIIYLVAA